LITWRLTGVPTETCGTPMRTTLMMIKSATAEEFIKTTEIGNLVSDTGKLSSKLISLDRNWGASRGFYIINTKEDVKVTRN
jgi:hypothetical protein